MGIIIGQNQGNTKITNQDIKSLLEVLLSKRKYITQRKVTIKDIIQYQVAIFADIYQSTQVNFRLIIVDNVS